MNNDILTFVILLLVLVSLVQTINFNKVVNNYEKQLSDKQKANEVLLQQVTALRKSLFNQCGVKK